MRRENVKKRLEQATITGGCPAELVSKLFGRENFMP